MAIVYDVVQDVGGVGTVGQVAHFVDDQDVGMGVGLERLVESPMTAGVGEVLDQVRRGGEEGLEAVWMAR
jgi:hypothetical protein